MAVECRIFLVGEGTTDIGDLWYPEYHRAGLAAGKRRYTPKEGFYQPLLRTLAKPEFEVRFDGGRFQTLGRNLLEPKDALAKKARGALAVAATSECSVLVFTTDTDREQGVKRSRREAASLREEKLAAIEAGFLAAIEADEELASITRLVAIPARIVESWALADRTAVAKVAGGEVSLPSTAPEDLWGDEEDAASDHPKCILRRVFGGERDVDGTLLAEIATELSTEVLVEQCPMSFSPFAADIERAKGECASRA